MARIGIGVLMLCTAALVGCVSPGQRAPAWQSEARAVEYLKREVPAWHRDNGCFSCHNNGDAARALYLAGHKGHRVPTSTLADTIAWVTKPAQWDHNQGDPGSSDKILADVQFATSLLGAMESGHTSDARALAGAAARLLSDQDATGAWPIQPKTTIGSPATYGTPLATYLAVRFLKQAHVTGADEAIRKGEAWLRAARVENLPAAAAILMAFAHEQTELVKRRQNEALAFIRRAQTSDGGWGPYADSPSEAFDTAIALLALAELPTTPEIHGWIQRGRNYLVTQQLADGSWPETTRPSGNISYAQHLSTTGWATMALLKTRE